MKSVNTWVLGLVAAVGCHSKQPEAPRVEIAPTLATWTPRVNPSKPPGPAPEGMVWIPGGNFWMGTSDAHMPDTQPLHRVTLDGFWMDATVVTNERFEQFVKATGLVTLAEKKPRVEDYPQAIPENLVEGSVVFTPPKQEVPLDDHFRWWSYVAGASWRHPEGPTSAVATRAKHPVVHIAYEDAVAFCKWTNGRLPTEAEFEFASRGGLDRKRYVWGDDFMPNGKHMANTFQGHFPDTNTSEDGYPSTSPVATFPPNGFGLYDMSGNVWEWTADWYRADTYEALAEVISVNPKGPPSSYDPSEPQAKKRVHRGGSYLCTDQYCSRFVAGGRGKGEPDTGTNHLGFRCVRDAPQGSGSESGG